MLQSGADSPVNHALDGLLAMTDGPPAADQCLLHGPDIPQGSREAQNDFQVPSSLLMLPQGISSSCLLDGMAALQLEDKPANNAVLGVNLGGQHASVPTFIQAWAAPCSW
jgi:hypothetical protein